MPFIRSIYHTLYSASPLSIWTLFFFQHSPMKQQKWLYGRLKTQRMNEKNEENKNLLLLNWHTKQYNNTIKEMKRRKKLLKISSGWWQSGGVQYVCVCVWEKTFDMYTCLKFSISFFPSLFKCRFRFDKFQLIHFELVCLNAFQFHIMYTLNTTIY